MIEIRDLAFRTLDIPELVIPPGDTALIGPNGSGKTTLLQVLAGVLKPEKGVIRINGKRPGGCRIGFVNEYPDRNILFSRVSDEIAAPLRFSRLPCSEIPRNVELALERAGIVLLMHRPVHTLSGGEKTLVSLLAATIHSPDVLILDEFDSHLDERAVAAAEQVIRAAGASSVLRCTQDMEAALRSNTVVALFSGRIRASGNPNDVFSSLSGTCFVPFGWRGRR